MKLFGKVIKKNSSGEKKWSRQDSLALYDPTSYTLNDLEYLVAVRGMNRKKQIQARFRQVRTLGWSQALIIATVLFASAQFFSLVPAGAEHSYNADAQDSDMLTLNFVGDVMLGRSIMTRANITGYADIFSSVTDYWDAADLVFANLESTVLAEDESEYETEDKPIHLYSTYAGIEAASEAGIDVWALANNHTFDYGETALLELVEYFDEQDITYAGAGANTEDAANYVLIEAEDLNIAFISITEVYYQSALADESKAGVLSTAYSDYELLVSEAASEADLTVVYIHWGEENAISADETQRSIGHALADAGADVIIGSHPHVLQEIELYEESIIFYSLGNFVFDQASTFSKDSAMVEYNLTSDGRGYFRVYSVRIDDGAPYVTTNILYQLRIHENLSQGLESGSFYLDSDRFIIIPFDIS